MISDAPDSVLPVSPETPVLEASNLRKSFRGAGGEIVILGGVSFALAAAQSVSIRGESGSGKTTFLNVLAGLERSDQGSLRWDSREVHGKSPAELATWRARYLGMVFQAYYLIPELTAYENVLFPGRLLGRLHGEQRDRARGLLESVGLAGRLHSLPATLSGGERQRVAVARALMNRPRVVLADEPTGNLDEKTAGIVMNLILDICRAEKAALVLVTHSELFAGLTSRRLVLHEGQLR